MQFDTLLSWLFGYSSHISLNMFITGMLLLVPAGLERMNDPRLKYTAEEKNSGELRKTITVPVSIGQLLTGVFNLIALTVYTLNVLQGRPLNIPAWFSLLGGGMVSFASATKTVPWAIVGGGGAGLLGGYAVFNLISPVPQAGAGLGILIGVILLYGVWILVKPWEDALHNVGKAASYSSVASLLGMVLSVFGVISGFGVVLF